MANCAVIKISRHPDGGWLVQQYHKDGSEGVSHLLHSGNPPWDETIVITEGQFTSEQAERIDSRESEVADSASN